MSISGTSGQFVIAYMEMELEYIVPSSYIEMELGVEIQENRKHSVVGKRKLKLVPSDMEIVLFRNL